MPRNFLQKEGEIEMRKFLLGALFALLIILIPLILTNFGRDSIKRDTFYSEETLKNRSVFCSERNELALETYCRIIRAGAYPVHSRDEADINIFVRKDILFVTDKTEEVTYLNIPLGKEYRDANGHNYLFLMHKFISEYHPAPSHAKPKSK